MSHREGAAPIGIVEDDPQCLALLQSQLDRLGYRDCFSAEDSASALQLTEERSPCALLVSADLGDGHIAPRIAAQVRARWDIPCVILTKHLDDSTLARCQGAEPSGYLVKPAPLEVLRALLATLAGREYLKRELQGQERLRRQAELLFDDALSNIPLAVLLVGEDRRVREANKPAEGFFARTREELVGSPSEALLKPTTNSELAGAGANCLAVLPGDQLAAAQVHSVNLWHSSGTLVAHFIHDARPRVALQRQFFNTHNAIAVNHLCDTLAHDFNNLLGALQTLLFLLAEGATQTGPQLQELEQAIERGSRLTEQLAQLSRSNDWELQMLDLERQLQQVVPLCRRVLGDGIALDVTLQGPATCRIAPAQLQQILFALLLNAREAMPSGGRVTVDLSLQATSPPYAVIEVTDTGTGMAPADVARAFDPFFSTKPGHEGLGLVSARRMAEQLGGSLFLSSRIGSGTQAVLSLPLL